MEIFFHFTFEDNSNPYIATTINKAFSMFCKYNFCQTGPGEYYLSSRSGIARTYAEKKAIAEELAIDFQNSFSDGMTYFYSDLSEYTAFFEKIGKKYGLLREYKENAII